MTELRLSHNVITVSISRHPQVEEAEMICYRAVATESSLAMDNRRSIRCGADGKLDPGLLVSYLCQGFYIYEGVLDALE